MLGPDNVPHEQIFDNFKRLGRDFLCIKAYGNSLKAGGDLDRSVPADRLSDGLWHRTLFTIDAKSLLLLAIILPFWTSFLIRVYAWMSILGKEGVLNDFLLAIGVINEPLQILYTPTAMYIGIVYAYLPFMILPALFQSREDGHVPAGGGVRRHHRQHLHHPKA